MGVFALTVIGSAVSAGLIWLVTGSRFTLSDDPQQNHVLNMAAYFLVCAPVLFVLVFFGIGG